MGSGGFFGGGERPWLRIYFHVHDFLLS